MIINLIILFLVIILDNLDLLFLHLLGLLLLTVAVKLSAAVDLICLGILNILSIKENVKH